MPSFILIGQLTLSTFAQIQPTMKCCSVRGSVIYTTALVSVRYICNCHLNVPIMTSLVCVIRACVELPTSEDTVVCKRCRVGLTNVYDFI